MLCEERVGGNVGAGEDSTMVIVACFFRKGIADSLEMIKVDRFEGMGMRGH